MMDKRIKTIKDLDFANFCFLVNETKQEEVLKLCLKFSTLEQQQYLAKYGRTDTIKEMFARKLLPHSTLEQQEYLAKYGRTDTIKEMFRKKYQLKIQHLL